MRNIINILKLIPIALALFITIPICLGNARANVELVESFDDADNQRFELYFHCKEDVTDFKLSLRELEKIFSDYDRKFKGVERVNMFELSWEELKKDFMDCLCKNFNRCSYGLLEKLCKIFSAILLNNFIVNEHSGMMIVNYSMLYKTFHDAIMRPFEASLADYEVVNVDIYVDWENRRLVFTY